MSSGVRLKVCCIRSLAEAELAIACGADALGLVSEMPSGPGVVAESLIAEIASAVPDTVATFLLTSKRSVEEILAQHRRCRTTTIQLCDRLPPGSIPRLRRELPGVSLIPVVHVDGEESMAEAMSHAAVADAILLDTGSRSGPVKELGGTGRTHDWNVSREVVKRAGVPVYLAGGLNSDNVAGAVRLVAPFAVDVCSGVRVDGDLDEVRLRGFVAALQGPGRSMSN